MSDKSQQQNYGQQSGSGSQQRTGSSQATQSSSSKASKMLVGAPAEAFTNAGISASSSQSAWPTLHVRRPETKARMQFRILDAQAAKQLAQQAGGDIQLYEVDDDQTQFGSQANASGQSGSGSNPSSTQA